MTNKEKYKQAFLVLHTSENFSMEVKKMAMEKKRKINVAAAAAAVCVLAAGAGGSYAANVGGIQRTIQLWIEGDKTDAVMEVNPDGTYTLTYPDENGQEIERGGGGIAIDQNGQERPLTEEELLAELYSPDVWYEEDGSVWVSYYDQRLDITDKFDEDGVCYVKLSGGGKTQYMTIKYQNGYAMSPDRYLSPQEFN